jgi:hypothetical protein
MFGVRAKEQVVEFCESCSKLCDQDCRAASVREQTFDAVALLGPRI